MNPSSWCFSISTLHRRRWFPSILQVHGSCPVESKRSEGEGSEGSMSKDQIHASSAEILGNTLYFLRTSAHCPLKSLDHWISHYLKTPLGKDPFLTCWMVFLAMGGATRDALYPCATWRMSRECENVDSDYEKFVRFDGNVRSDYETSQSKFVYRTCFTHVFWYCDNPKQHIFDSISPKNHQSFSTLATAFSWIRHGCAVKTWLHVTSKTQGPWNPADGQKKRRQQQQQQWQPVLLLKLRQLRRHRHFFTCFQNCHWKIWKMLFWCLIFWINPIYWRICSKKSMVLATGVPVSKKHPVRLDTFTE